MRSEIRRQSGQLESGARQSVDLIEACLARVNDPNGEGVRVFTKVWAERARVAADAQDRLRRAGYAPSELAGIPISIKDLLDVRGETTLAGTKALDDAPPAQKDAPVVSRLKAAGAVLVGSTNMAQFAFSIVGMNPHFGTPGNPWDRKRIPGGSSSGAAVCVADGMATAAIGSDTVGSIRAPAALCGVVGFKPTQHRVSRDGAIPLSRTLDTIGPLARTVEDCALVHAAIAGEEFKPLQRDEVRNLRLAVPQTGVLDGLDAPVAAAFERLCRMLSKAGASLVDARFDLFEEIAASNACNVIEFADALAWHRDLLARRGADYDPNVRGRVEKGAEISGAAYARMRERRAELTHAFDGLTQAYDALILPTVPIIAPTIEAAERDEGEIRSKLLRNPSLFNFLDRPAITIPIHRSGDAPVGLMVVGARDADWQVFEIARAVEGLLTQVHG
jgi:aspartyl-tRNA(Asn)/glutamyl-tRNA(Gln) amidotransferase subunit A